MLDLAGNVFGVLFLSGAFTGAMEGAALQRKNELARKQRAATAAMCRSPDHGAWHERVQDMAARGFTLRALLHFFRGLGCDYMPHYDVNRCRFLLSRHKTVDVVRNAIIPLSRTTMTDFAYVMMRGARILPDKMITHNWDNVFRDLVASIIADALDEDSYSAIAYLLPKGAVGLDIVEKWLTHAGTLDNTYWVCAFSVNQHTGICGGNPYESTDTVTGQLYSLCNCVLPKAFNTTEPLSDVGKSIQCEMNKFDDMVAYLARTVNDFTQVIAVDEAFEAFNRAWCVAEIAKASRMGMKQRMKFSTADDVFLKEESLKGLRIEHMQASRPEDVQEILAGIPDHNAFNEELQHIIFDRLLADWKAMDTSQRLEHAGRLIRWHDCVQQRQSQGVWART